MPHLPIEIIEAPDRARGGRSRLCRGRDLRRQQRSQQQDRYLDQSGHPVSASQLGTLDYEASTDCDLRDLPIGSDRGIRGHARRHAAALTIVLPQIHLNNFIRFDKGSHPRESYVAVQTAVQENGLQN